MAADTMVLLAAICIALNTVTLVLILVMLSGIRQSIRRVETRFSTLASRVEDEVLSTLREVRGAVSDGRGMVRTGTRIIENLAFASIAGRLSGGNRLSSLLSSALMGFNLVQSVLRPLSRRSRPAAGTAGQGIAK